MHGITPITAAEIDAIIDSIGPSAGLPSSSLLAPSDAASEAESNDAEDITEEEDRPKFSQDLVVCPQADGDEKVLLISDYLGDEWEKMIVSDLPGSVQICALLIRLTRCV